MTNPSRPQPVSCLDAINSLLESANKNELNDDERKFLSTIFGTEEFELTYQFVMTSNKTW